MTPLEDEMSSYMSEGEFRDLMRVTVSDGCEKRTRETLTPNLLNLRWARNVANNNPHPSGAFVRAIATTALQADDANLDILQFSLTAFRKKYPTWDIEEAKS